MYKDGGAGQGNYYLLADPRLVEAHDDGTIVQSTGAARSSPQTLALVNPPCSQRLRGDTSQGDGGGRRRRNKAGDMMDVYREAIGGKSGNQDVEGRGQTQAGDMMAVYREAIGGKSGNQDGEGRGQEQVRGGEGRGQGRATDRIKEVRSIKGGGKRATRWVKVNMGGEEMNLYCDTGSNITIITPEMYKQSMGKVVAARSYLRA